MILIYFQTLGKNHGMIIMPRMVNSVEFMEFHKITDSLSFKLKNHFIKNFKNSMKVNYNK